MESKVLKVLDAQAELLRSSQFFGAAARGAIDRKTLQKYIINIHYLVRHTPIHLQKAVLAAQAQGLPELANFFVDKIREEEGHDNWSLADHQYWGFSDDSAGWIAPATHQLIAGIEQAINQDARKYLLYMLVNEYVTVHTTEELMGYLEKHCGLNREGFSVVTKHQEADKDHINHDIQALTEVVSFQSTDQILEQVKIWGEQLVDLLDDMVALHPERVMPAASVNASI